MGIDLGRGIQRVYILASIAWLAFFIYKADFKINSEYVATYSVISGKILICQKILFEKNVIKSLALFI